MPYDLAAFNAALQNKFGTATSAPQPAPAAPQVDPSAPMVDLPGAPPFPQPPAPVPAQEAAPAPAPAAAPQGMPVANQVVPQFAPPEVRTIRRGGGDIDMRTAAEKQLLAQRVEGADEASQNAYYQRQAALANRQAALDEQANLQKADAARMQAHAADFQKEAQAREAEMAADAKRLADSKEDEDQWWGSRSGGQKVAAFLNVAFRGFAGKDPMGDVNNAIERNIRTQRANYERQAQGLRAKESAYGRFVQRYGSTQAADEAMRSVHLQQVQNMLSKADTGNLAADARERLASMQDQVAAMQMQSIQRGVKHQMASSTQMVKSPWGTWIPASQYNQFMAQRMGHAADKAVDVSGQMAVEGMKQKGKAAEDMSARTVVVTGPTGERMAVTARSKEEALKLSTGAASVNNLRGLAAEKIKLIQEIRSAGALANPLKMSELKRELGQVDSEMVLEYKNAKQLGALSGGDVELAEGGLGKGSAFAPGAVERVQKFVQHTENAFNKTLQTLPGQQDPRALGLAKEAAPSFIPKGGQ